MVNEGASFEFRCEYGKGSTEMRWIRQRKINGSVVVDYIPRSLVTVQTDSRKSVEVYSIEKVTLEDSGTYKCEVTENGNLRSTRLRLLQVKSK